MQLEPLCQQLGIAEHIPALSEWRDELLRAKAEEMQLAAIAAQEDKAAALAKKDEALAALQAPPTPAAPPVLVQLAAVFTSLDPAIQRAFSGAFAVVRTLIQADQAVLARGYIEDLTVPAELEDTRAGIVALLT